MATKGTSLYQQYTLICGNSRPLPLAIIRITAPCVILSLYASGHCTHLVTVRIVTVRILVLIQVIVEPGTPKGFEAVMHARSEILRMERSVRAPYNPPAPYSTVQYCNVQLCTLFYRSLHVRKELTVLIANIKATLCTVVEGGRAIVALKLQCIALPLILFFFGRLLLGRRGRGSRGEWPPRVPQMARGRDRLAQGKAPAQELHVQRRTS